MIDEQQELTAGEHCPKCLPLIDNARVGSAGAAPAVAAAHARGVVGQRQQLLRQLPVAHQQERGRLRCWLHLQATGTSVPADKKLNKPLEDGHTSMLW